MLIVCDGAVVRLISQLRNGGFVRITWLSGRDRKWAHSFTALQKQTARTTSLFNFRQQTQAESDDVSILNIP